MFVLLLFIFSHQLFAQTKFYIEDCNGNIYSPPSNSNYPDNVEWYVYWYRSSNGERWGTSGPYKSIQKAIEVMNNDIKSCGDCILCDRELWCNSKIIAKTPISDCYSNNSYKLGLKNWIAQTLKSFREFIKPSSGGNLRNVGDVQKEYSRVLNLIYEKQKELRNKNLPWNEFNELTNELETFKYNINEEIKNFSIQDINQRQINLDNQIQIIQQNTKNIRNTFNDLSKNIINELWQSGDGDQKNHHWRKENDPTYDLYLYRDHNENHDDINEYGINYLNSYDFEHNDITSTTSIGISNHNSNISKNNFQTNNFIENRNKLNFKAKINENKIFLNGFTSSSGSIIIYIDQDKVYDGFLKEGNFSIELKVSSKYSSGFRTVHMYLNSHNEKLTYSTNLIKKY